MSNKPLHDLYNLLVDLAEGRTGGSAGERLRGRLSADPEAQAELARITALLGLMRADDSVDAPPHVIGRALRRLRRPAPPEAPGLIRRVFAALRNDSWEPPLALGLRVELPGPRDLAYSAGDCDLDLQIVPRAGRWQLRGQILGAYRAGAAELRGQGATVTAPVNELGEFTLPAVAAGRYALTLRLSERELIVAGLDLGPAAPAGLPT